MLPRHQLLELSATVTSGFRGQVALREPLHKWQSSEISQCCHGALRIRVEVRVPSPFPLGAAAGPAKPQGCPSPLQGPGGVVKSSPDALVIVLRIQLKIR